MAKSTVDQIEVEISRLADYISKTDDFGESTTVNVHSLVCLMRYSAWKEGDQFERWVKSKKMERNHGVLDRIILMKSIDESLEDGIEFRVHIFRDGNETFIHSHKQDFVTSCIQGYYIHKIWDIEEDESKRIRVQVRTPKTGVLADFDLSERTDLLGLPVEADGDGTFIRGGFKNPVRETKFSVGDKPMFVDRNWHHTVLHEDTSESVITIVARRGDRSKPTTVLSDPDGGAKDPVVNTVDGELSEREKDDIFQELMSALMNRGQHRKSDSPSASSDLSRYMTKIGALVRFDHSVADSPESKEAIRTFLESNGFTMAPLVDEDGKCVGILRRPVSLEGQAEGLIRREPQSIEISEHLFGAVLFNVVSRDLVVPVTEENGKLAGVFSISDLVEDESFPKSLIYHLSLEQDEGRGLETARNFNQSLRELCQSFDGGKSRSDIDSLVHGLLLELEKLIVMNTTFDFGRDPESHLPSGSVWLEEVAQWPMYKFRIQSFDSEAEVASARVLLDELKRGSDIDQILIESSEGEVRMMSTTSDSLTEIETTPLEASFGDLLNTLRDSPNPIILRREGEFGIVTESELQHPLALLEIAGFILENPPGGGLTELLRDHILHSRSGGKSPLTLVNVHQFLES